MAEQVQRTCDDCLTVLKPSASEDRCPGCGSTNIQRDALFPVMLEVRPGTPVNVSVTNAPGPRKKAPTRIEVKHELHRDTGRWQQTHRTFDHANDEYIERFTDVVTGDVVEKRDRLSEHNRHRSAKH